MRLQRWLHPVAVLDAWWEDVSPKRRLDRGPVYMSVLIGLIGPSLSIVLIGPVPNSAVEGMSETLQISMCACIFGGCTIMLYATLLGSRWFGPRAHRSRSYRLGYSGAPAAVAGLLVYGVVILSNSQNFLSAVGGVLTPMLGAGLAIQAVLFWLESRRIEHNERRLIKLRVDERHDS